MTPHGWARPLWLMLGCAALACGFVGAVLPLIPTTPFLLLAAFAFAKSSPRLHAWLVTHKHFGPLIENWRLHGAIGRRTKLLSVSIMAVMPLVSWLVGAPLWTLWVQIPVLFCAAAFVLSRPDAPKTTPLSAPAE